MVKTTSKKEFFIPESSSYQEVFLPIKQWLTKSSNVVCIGQLGAGKTTLIKEFCQHVWNVEDMSSPSYSLINLHPLPSGSSFSELAHMDLYRLKSTDELIDIGGEDYLYDPTIICMIEWPELALPLLEDMIAIHLEILPGGGRKLILSLSE